VVHLDPAVQAALSSRGTRKSLYSPTIYLFIPLLNSHIVFTDTEWDTLRLSSYQHPPLTVGYSKYTALVALDRTSHGWYLLDQNIIYNAFR